MSFDRLSLPSSLLRGMASFNGSAGYFSETMLREAFEKLALATVLEKISATLWVALIFSNFMSRIIQW